MAKVKLVEYKHDGVVHHRQLWISCPGCKTTHAIGYGPQFHRFNGDFDSPTFEPSLLCNWTRYKDPDDYTKGSVDMRCHSFVRAGKIQFLSDCTHELANQTVDLLDVKEGEGSGV